MKESVQINMDIFVNIPCGYLEINARDLTMDRHVVSEELVMEDMIFFIPYDTRVNDITEIITPELDEILGEAIPSEFREKIDMRMYYDEENPDAAHLPDFNGCHIFGSIPVNRVVGELQITVKGMGYSRERTPLEKINFAHVINEFSFGDFYPYIDNPLDNSAKYDDDPLTKYVYYTSVVPTLYQKLGAEVDTNQYAVSEYRYNSSENKGSVPGIFFKYNFESLSIAITDKRLSFLQFIVRLVAIMSFVFFVASWVFILVDMGLVFFLGPKWSLRYQPDVQSHGILE